MKVFREYKKENPEINSHTLILSGKDLPYIGNKEMPINNKNEIKSHKEKIKIKIKELLGVQDVDINFTLKSSDFYENMEEFMEKRNKRIEIQHIIKKIGVFAVVAKSINLEK